MTLKLITLFGSHLNLNGDQANLLVAQKRLAWRGQNVELIQLSKGDSIPGDADFIFLGHGSIAAWADIDSALVALVPAINNLISNGVGFMAVATGHERAIQLGLIPGEFQEVPRVSKFEIANLAGKEVLGYLNSATTAPVIQKHGLLLGTQLHGPVFAKNPELCDSYFEELAKVRGKGIETIADAQLSNNADLVAGIVEQVWDLERALASE